LIGVSIDPGRIFRTRAERNPSPFVTYTKHPRFSLQKKAYRRMTPGWLHIFSILSPGARRGLGSRHRTERAPRPAAYGDHEPRLAGFVTAYPVNWWLIKIGIKEAM